VVQEENYEEPLAIALWSALPHNRATLSELSDAQWALPDAWWEEYRQTSDKRPVHQSGAFFQIQAGCT
jgi:hypothetical protein